MKNDTFTVTAQQAGGVRFEALLSATTARAVVNLLLEDPRLGPSRVRTKPRKHAKAIAVPLKACVFCANRFRPQKGQKFCSDACRKKAAALRGANGRDDSLVEAV
jgi:hypothetical protein